LTLPHQGLGTFAPPPKGAGAEQNPQAFLAADTDPTFFSG